MIYKDKGLIYGEYVVAGLSHYLSEDIKIKIETFYNCREMGYLLVAHDCNYINTIYVWVYAHRNSDNPTIVWSEDREFNNMFTEEAWNERQTTYETIEEAMWAVKNLLEDKIK